MGLRTWLTKDLYRGDMHALQAIANGRSDNIDMGQLSRLRGRGFITKIFWGRARMTPKGALALLLRLTVVRPTLGPEDG
jgi:hypothetical protein